MFEWSKFRFVCIIVANFLIENWQQCHPYYDPWSPMERFGQILVKIKKLPTIYCVVTHFCSSTQRKNVPLQFASFVNDTIAKVTFDYFKRTTFLFQARVQCRRRRCLSFSSGDSCCSGSGISQYYYVHTESKSIVIEQLSEKLNRWLT